MSVRRVPSPAQAHTCCGAGGSDTPRPRQNAAGYPEKAPAVLTVLERGPLGPAGEAQHSVTAGSPRPAAPGPPPPPDSPEDDGVPHHDVVLGGGPAHPGRGILLQPAGHTERSGDSPAGRPCALGVTQAGGRAPLRKQRNPQAAGAERRYAISGARPTPPPCCAAPLLPR